VTPDDKIGRKRPQLLPPAEMVSCPAMLADTRDLVDGELVGEAPRVCGGKVAITQHGTKSKWKCRNLACFAEGGIFGDGSLFVTKRYVDLQTVIYLQ